MKLRKQPWANVIGFSRGTRIWEGYQKHYVSTGYWINDSPIYHYILNDKPQYFI